MANRLHTRRPIGMLFNKYLGGHPYRCRTVDITCEGLRAESFADPEDTDDSFTLELRLPYDKDSLWIWARRVWQRDGEQALQFVNMKSCDHERLRKFLTPSGYRPVPLFPEELLEA